MSVNLLVVYIWRFFALHAEEHTRLRPSNVFGVNKLDTVHERNNADDNSPINMLVERFLGLL